MKKIEHKWLAYFDENGNWTRPERRIRVNAEWHDLDEYAKEHGVELPDSKKAKPSKNKDIEVNINADLDEQNDPGHSEIHRDGDSESTE